MIRRLKFKVNLKQHAKYFEAIILPIDATKRDILYLETTYQMGEDSKLDYGPIEKYLKVKDMLDEGFTEDEIATSMRVSKKDVKKFIRILKLMDRYLDSFNRAGMYTLLKNEEDGSTREDSFINLESSYCSYLDEKVPNMRDIDDVDIEDFLYVAFCYIRIGFNNHDFREIVRKPNKNNIYSSFFASKDVWDEFLKNHIEIIEKVPEEELVEDIKKNNPGGDINRILIEKDRKWRVTIDPCLIENFQNCRDKLNNIQQATKPEKLLRKALEAMSAIDTSLPSFKDDSNVKIYLDKIEDIVKKYKSMLQQ